MKKLLCLLMCSTFLCSCGGTDLNEESTAIEESIVIEENSDNLKVYMFADVITTSEEYIYQSFYTLGEFTQKSLFWGNKSHLYYNAMEEFNKQTGIDIDLTVFGTTQEMIQKLNNDSEKGTLPDVVVGSYCSEGYDLYSLIEDGYFKDLKPYFEENDMYSGGQYVEEVLRAGNIRGQQLIFPLSFNMNILMSSKENLDEKQVENLDGFAYEEMVRFFTEKWQDESTNDDVLLLEFSDILNTYPFYLFDVESGVSYYDTETRENVLDKDHFEMLANLYSAYIKNDYGMNEKEVKELMSKAGHSTMGLNFQNFSKNAMLTADIKKVGVYGFGFVRSNVGYIADGGSRSYCLHSFAAQAGYYESRFSDEEEEFVCVGIPSREQSDEYSAIVTTFGGVISDSDKAELGFQLLKLMADTSRHMYFDLSVNREQIEISLNQLRQTSTEFYPAQGDYPPDIVPEGEEELWLGEKYIIKPMTEKTSNYLLDLVNNIGDATLPDNAARNAVFTELQKYVYGETETIDEAYNNAVIQLDLLR